MQISILLINALRGCTLKKAFYFCFSLGYPKLLDQKCLFLMYHLLIAYIVTPMIVRQGMLPYHLSAV